ncbi:MAG: hypothetical protein IJW47_01370 [Clostridia bacterium]|nr:hypothetical protein [Clostridia bacterium]
MNEKFNEQTETTAQTVETEEEKKGVTEEQVSLGKFKDVNALLHAYNSLQAEFTKRCQRIKELEGAQNVEKATAPTNSEVQCSEEKVSTGITDKDKEQILKDYLKGLLGAKQQAVILDGVGGGINTPISRPKSLAEAGKLAQEILK